ncbi:MAG TPA: hypothetical protein VK400_12915 [Pyrinomonadaceae bacterium]|nr:hypothetical protein [Pyrinomonadaceae bacterium]
MPSTAIVCGVLLILIGIIGYVYGLMGGAGSRTALIPAGVGLVLAILGYLAKSKENMRMHLMHAAVIVGLLGFLASLVDFIRTGFRLEASAPVISKIAMALVCLIFVILCVKSFIDARRSRVA